MKKRTLFLLIILSASLFFGLAMVEDKWIIKQQNGYSLYYTALDRQNINEYNIMFEKGIKKVENFFQNSFKNNFGIYIHSSRTSLDSAWQRDWNMPNFKSQCWMVASGVSHKFDIISPKKWDSLACEHSYSNLVKTQRLIVHELVHVFHGQQNKSSDFSDVTGIDWFIEGLAVYASGQCDAERMAEIKNAVSSKKIPQNLNKFWSGKLKYGISGSVVMYLDKKYGRKKLISLLKFNHIKELLDSLETTELEIITGWAKYIQNI